MNALTHTRKPNINHPFKRVFLTSLIFIVIMTAISIVTTVSAEAAPIRVSPLDHNSQGSQVTAADDGTFVVAWKNGNNSTSPTGIYFQRFDPFGTPVGEVVFANADPLNECASGYNDHYAFDGAADGSFVVVWSQPHAISECMGVHFRRFDSQGNPIGNIVRANPPWPLHFISGYTGPAVGVFPGGGFVIAWVNQNVGVFFQRYDWDGLPIGSLTQASFLTHGFEAITPVIAVAVDGSFVLSWRQYEDLYGWVSQLYDPVGMPVGGPKPVPASPYLQTHFQAAIAMDEDAAYVAAGMDRISPYGHYIRGILHQEHDELGVPIGFPTWTGHRPVIEGCNSSTDGIFLDLNDGALVVGWGAGFYQEDCPGERGAFFQRYLAISLPYGDIVMVGSPYPYGSHGIDDLEIRNDWSIVVTWTEGDAAYFDIFDFDVPGISQLATNVVIEEGSVAESFGAFSDPDENFLSLTSDCAGFVNLGGGSWIWSHLVVDGPTTTNCLVTAVTTSGETAMDAFQVKGINLSPILDAIIAPVDPVKIGSPTSTEVTFTDQGINDTHTVSWQWGDGQMTSGTVVESDGSGTAYGAHVYSSPGVHTIEAIVTDKDGASANAIHQFIVTYDPDGGFVTGGGWIESPPGSYVPDPTLFGKANFGFVSKYEKGASVPTGDTQFRFRVADLTFHSDIYDWLVIAGARAMFKGIGTINNLGSYGFMLTAIDGALPGGQGTDKFRIKIWDKENGDVLVYDNEIGSDEQAAPFTALGGGSIVIHKH